MNDSGINFNTKRGVVIGLLVGLTIGITIITYNLLKQTMFGLLAGVVGFVSGIAISSLLYNTVLKNKELEEFENSAENKLHAFFKVSQADLATAPLVNDVEYVRLNNYSMMIVLSLHLGNTNAQLESVTEEFLDKLFYLCNKDKLKVDPYIIQEDWESSNMFKRHLEGISKIPDKKLRENMLLVSEHQSKIFMNSLVPTIYLRFICAPKEMKKFETVIDYVNIFIKKSLINSSLREANWLTSSEIFKVSCRYLGVKLVDISPLSANKVVPIDVRALFNVSQIPSVVGDFNHNKAIKIDTNSKTLRASKFRKAKKKKGAGQ